MAQTQAPDAMRLGLGIGAVLVLAAVAYAAFTPPSHSNDAAALLHENGLPSYTQPMFLRANHTACSSRDEVVSVQHHAGAWCVTPPADTPIVVITAPPIGDTIAEIRFRDGPPQNLWADLHDVRN